MNLPHAPIAHEDFFATHFVTVKDQEKSKVSALRGKGSPAHPSLVSDSGAVLSSQDDGKNA